MMKLKLYVVNASIGYVLNENENENSNENRQIIYKVELQTVKSISTSNPSVNNFHDQLYHKKKICRICIHDCVNYIEFYVYMFGDLFGVGFNCIMFVDLFLLILSCTLLNIN